MAGAGDIRAGGAFVELYAGQAGQVGFVSGLDVASQKIEQWRVATNAANKDVIAGGGKAAEQFHKMGTAVLTMAVAINAAKAGMVAVGAVSAALRGDWEKVEELIYRLPLGLGQVARITATIRDELSGVAEDNARQAESAKDVIAGLRGNLELIKIIAVAGRAGESPTDKLFRERNELLAKIDGMEGSYELKERARQEVRKAFALEYEKIRTAAYDEYMKKKWAAEDKEHDRLIARSKELADAAAEAAKERAADNERYRAEAHQGWLDEQLDAAEAAARTGAAGAAIIGQGNRGVTAASAAAIQSLQTTPAMNKMVQNLDDIKRTNQLIADNAQRFD